MSDIKYWYKKCFIQNVASPNVVDKLDIANQMLEIQFEE